MPGGRPPKFQTQQERLQARRAQVRQNVRAWRSRKQLASAGQGCIQIFKEDDARPEPNDSTSNAVTHHRNYAPTTVDDIADASARPRVDLYFGIVPAILADLDRATVRYPWAEASAQLRPADRILDQAILAGGTRLMSNMYGQPALEALARAAYHATLGKLRARMAARPADLRDTLLLGTVVTALANFEVGDGSARTRGSRWAVHAAAVMALMRGAGPDMFASPLGLRFLRSQRHTAISLAMWDPAAMFLHEAEWATRPFAVEGKTREDELWDLLWRLPRLVQRTQALAGAAAGASSRGDGAVACASAATKLLAGLVAHRRDLNAWLADYEAAAPTQLVHSAAPAPWFAVGLATDIFPGGALHFPSLLEAESMVAYWASLVQGQLLAAAAQRMLMAAAFETLAAPFAAFLQDNAGAASVAACNVCRSMEYCLGESPADLRGAIICGNMPFQIAIKYFRLEADRYREELAWCDIVAARIAKRCLLSGQPLAVLTV